MPRPVGRPAETVSPEVSECRRMPDSRRPAARATAPCAPSWAIVTACRVSRHRGGKRTSRAAAAADPSSTGMGRSGTTAVTRSQNRATAVMRTSQPHRTGSTRPDKPPARQVLRPLSPTTPITNGCAAGTPTKPQRRRPPTAPRTTPLRAHQSQLPPEVAQLWGRRPVVRRGRRPGLGLEEITRAAVRVADAEGLAAVSMARVAQELGNATIALYRHVGGKDELLLLVHGQARLGVDLSAGFAADPQAFDA